MHLAMHVPQRISSMAFNVRHWIGSLEEKVAKLPRKTDVSRISIEEFREAIPALSIILGAAAFGLWWESFGAALFAGCALFFLARIYGAMDRVVAAVSRWEHERSELAEMKPETPAPDPPKIAPMQSASAARAIERLQPWLDGDASLTEEEAKSCCASLLEKGAAVSFPLRPQT